jgi:hypothetical protein
VTTTFEPDPTILAWIAVALVVPLLDPLATIPPAPLFVAPIPLLLISITAVVLLAWIGGWITSVRTRSVDLGEVMRLAN